MVEAENSESKVTFVRVNWYSIRNNWFDVLMILIGVVLILKHSYQNQSQIRTCYICTQMLKGFTFMFLMKFMN